MDCPWEAAGIEQDLDAEQSLLSLVGLWLVASHARGAHLWVGPALVHPLLQETCEGRSGGPGCPPCPAGRGWCHPAVGDRVGGKGSHGELGWCHEPAHPLLTGLMGLFLGLWLHCEPLNLPCPSTIAWGQADGRGLGRAGVSVEQGAGAVKVWGLPHMPWEPLGSLAALVISWVAPHSVFLPSQPCLLGLSSVSPSSYLPFPHFLSHPCFWCMLPCSGPSELVRAGMIKTCPRKGLDWDGVIGTGWDPRLCLPDARSPRCLVLHALSWVSRAGGWAHEPT